MEDSGIDSGDHNGDQKTNQSSERFPVLYIININYLH